MRATETGSSSDIVVIDELGPIELNGQGFSHVPEQIETGRFKNCLAVVRKQLLEDVLPLLDKEVLVFKTTIDNRDKLPEEIVKTLAR